MKVGIDLGTTYSAVAYVNKDGQPEIIENEFDEETTPSIVAFCDGDIVVGREARELQAAGLSSVVSSFKRNMGDPEYFYEYDGKKYSATDLSAILLKHMKEVAEQRMGQTIDSAVITVPAYFNDLQKIATMEAGRAAGLNVEMLVHEPTAASVCYGMKNSKNSTMMTYDLGGGTFDITILRITDGSIEVVGTLGDPNLGGKDWDEVVKEILADQFMDEFSIDLHNDDEFVTKFSVEAEKIKKMLSFNSPIRVPLRFSGKSMVAVVTREDFEFRSSGLVDSTVQMCEQLLSDLSMTWSDLSDVILVGGSTRLPAIREALKASGVNLIINEDTDTAVAKGAALLATSDEGRISKRKPGEVDTRIMKVSDAIAHSLGALAEDSSGTRYINDVIIPRSSKIPAVEKRPFEIRKGNFTEKIDIYTLQGESKHPLECTVLKMVTAEGIENDGRGVKIEIEYSYDRSGMVNVQAFQDGKPLTMVKGEVPEDVSWMGKPIERQKMESVPVYVILSMDLSGSMCGKPIKNATKAAHDFVSMLPNARFAVIGYANKTKVLCTDKSAKEVGRYIDALQDTEVGGGNTAHPFDEILRISPRGKFKVFEITLTDGMWSCCPAAIESASKCMDVGIGCIAVGFGSADYKFLKKISSMDEGALMSSVDGLSATFSTIASTISTGGFNRFIR
ncbi:MAG: Hsp70 family protein [Candidatus Methanomethylophilaceae archaeon]|jgi:molecular chaperone DnaK|nr:Hsp70 family protein [Candidatus Methanomethylophilaceae archaeon]MBR3477211.1 Hsp70 family protein [Candidatus Methanomethylophilaceae archaeon]MBR4182014.1 Hsp70 family protein [Candidatus Methanomethylophilaceae archaeon]